MSKNSERQESLNTAPTAKPVKHQKTCLMKWRRLKQTFLAVTSLREESEAVHTFLENNDIVNLLV